MTDRQSLADQLDNDHGRSLGMAAARGAVDAVALINRAVRTAGIPQRHMAERIGITEGRVSQVLNGDGNMRISTLARFLRAVGYRLTLDAAPIDENVRPLPSPSPRTIDPELRFITVRDAVCVNDNGAGPEPIVQLSHSHPRDLGHSYTLVIDAQTGRIERPVPVGRTDQPRASKRDSGRARARGTEPTRA